MATRETSSEGRPAAAVLTHPAFNRPPVHNERRRGRPAGTVSIARARRERERSIEEARRNIIRSHPPHDVRVEQLLEAARLQQVGHARASDDAAVIVKALALLGSRLRQPGAVMDSPCRVRAFLALHLADLEREEFRIMFLDGRNALIAFESFGLGTLTQAPVYPREVVRRALALNAGAVILTHNHPSLNPEPSRDDEMLTARLRQALALVDVRVLDHMIVGGTQVVSMAERGML